MKRRDFIKSSAVTGGSLALLRQPEASAREARIPPLEPQSSSKRPRLPDLRPARWLWYPSGRCLPNTFVLFRREIELGAKPKRAAGWIAAESRYKLEANGRRIQWGPPPSDPRFAEADPVDLTDVLEAGRNALGASVLFYGHGDGTAPFGKPGFLFWLEIEYGDGSAERIVSDSSWRAHLARAWRPGQPKRWYLRALQEEFDARLYPYGWTAPGFGPNSDWVAAMELKGSPNKPALSTDYYEYVNDILEAPPEADLRPRSIPLLAEKLVPVSRLAESMWLEWRRPPEEYFALRAPDAFDPVRLPSAAETGPGQWTVILNEDVRGAALTFELEEQVVGWPYFTIEAPAGTTVELLVHEAHEVGGPALINSHFDSWSRFICRQGLNRFECFDFESLRWLQLHIHGARGRIKIRDVGVRRRLFPWPNAPHIRSSEPQLQSLFAASINTLNNCAQETLVDGMARERQQYSGDCGHQTHAIYLAFGETRQPARYLTTFSPGQTLDGYFLDCWPAYDRLARLVERQFGLTRWGPILDHGIGFCFDCWHHYLYTGNLEAVRESYPRLVRFAQYLQSIRGPDRLLPVEGIGTPSVWMDHNAYRQQRHKQCAFNLYAAAMLEHALAPLCRAFGDGRQARAATEFARELLAATARKFWSTRERLYIINKPWLGEEKDIRLCDRSLATAVLFNQCPGMRIEPAVRVLAECPEEMGFSYPANAGWRLWALAKGGRAEVIVRDLRERWARMDSVRLNNTLQEDWQAKPDSGQQWSHCAVAPLYIAYMGLAGIRPITPGFERVEVRPQPADLDFLELTARTVRGPLFFRSEGKKGRRDLTLELPSGCEGELVVPREENLNLPVSVSPSLPGLKRHRLAPGRPIRLRLKYT
jgi:alpha-L-rhamnosidase